LPVATEAVAVGSHHHLAAVVDRRRLIAGQAKVGDHAVLPLDDVHTVRGRLAGDDLATRIDRNHLESHKLGPHAGLPGEVVRPIG
jgi:hypothetical protein